MDFCNKLVFVPLEAFTVKSNVCGLGHALKD